MQLAKPRKSLFDLRRRAAYFLLTVRTLVAENALFSAAHAYAPLKALAMATVGVWALTRRPCAALALLLY
jgi:hypothetical protein